MCYKFSPFPNLVFQKISPFLPISPSPHFPISIPPYISYIASHNPSHLCQNVPSLYAHISISPYLQEHLSPQPTTSQWRNSGSTKFPTTQPREIPASPTISLFVNSHPSPTSRSNFAWKAYLPIWLHSPIWWGSILMTFPTLLNTPLY